MLAELAAGREARLSRLVPAFALPGQRDRQPLSDPYLSRKPLRFMPAEDGSVRLLRGEMATNVSVDGEPLGERRSLAAADIARGTVLLLAKRVALLLHRLNPSPPKKGPSWGLIGDSDLMVRLRQEIAREADLAGLLLLRGEPGTGKALLAGAIHEAGPRRERAYVALDLAALPPAAAGAEMFADAFSRARGGTLFLRRVGETPPAVQSMLLGALDSGEEQGAGVRVIAATDADVERSGQFPAALLQRLGGSEIRLPSLRERRDDVGRLFFHFFHQELEARGEAGRLRVGPEENPFVPAALVARLAGLDWPGNVRQLRDVVRQIDEASRGTAEAWISPQAEALLAP